MNSFIQTSFKGGMNFRDSSDILTPEEYVFGVNIRARDKRLTTVPVPVEDTNLPDGIKQGLFALRNYLILFAGGKAYYKLYTATNWTPILGFQMSISANVFYAALVIGSSLNFQRIRADATATTVNYKTSGAELVTASGTPAGLLVQDGENQPWIIFPDLTSRVTNSYAQWLQGSAQEYVPIGTQMAVVGSKLFIKALDNVRIYQSVSGRMLDFVVNITTSGAAGGNADTTSFAINGEPITGLLPVSLTSLFVSTATNCWIVALDYNNRLFGEPTYSNNPLMASGITNERSIIELQGDFLFIDFNGIRSFNAVTNLKFEGQNSPFSALLSTLFIGRLQSAENTAAIAFNNYGIFSVFTQMGYVLAIYDGILDKWVSVDQHACVRIKHFAKTTGASTEQLWGLTTTGRVFQLEAGSTKLSPAIKTRSFSDVNLNVEQQSKELVCQFENGVSGELRIYPYSDGQRYPSKTRTLRDTTSALLWPIEFPIEFASKDNVDVVSIPIINVPYSRKAQFYLAWSGGAALNSLQVNMNKSEGSVGQEQKTSYASAINNA